MGVVDVSAEQLIASYRDLIRWPEPPHSASSARPCSRSAVRPTTDAAEAKPLAVNEWIRTSGEYDAIVDLDAVLADPADRSRLAAAFDSGDRPHPNDSGYRIMAATVDPADIR
ncbi:hypothetical protein [Nocardia sp. CA-119907]|uniref:hypothetical protein n=1 Tax=Nocardia sp. CA-119907 TaxID=3239973 RepID=UPI003D993989